MPVESILLQKENETMAIQMAELLQNARLNSIDAHIGASPILKIFSGAKPADCGQSDPTGELVSMTLPATWMNAAATGQKTLAGTWSASASGTGTALSFRIYTSGAVCKIQGTVGQGSGDLSLDNTSINTGQTVTVTAFTLNEGND